MKKGNTAYTQRDSFSIRQAIRIGWENVKSYPGVLIGAAFVTAVISMLFPLILSAIGKGKIVVSVLVNLASIVVQAGLTLGLIQLSIRAYRDQAPSFSDLFSVFDLRLLKHLGASILYGLMVVVGTVLFIIPGIYAALTFLLFPYAIVEYRAGPIEALRYSKRVTTGSRWRLLLFLIVSGLVNMVGLLALGIGFFVSAPVVAVATVAVYEALKQGRELEDFFAGKAGSETDAN